MSPAPLRTSRRFRQVDVFTAELYRGNPLAVVLDGAGLSDAAMQAFARWTQLSETTFVLPPTDPGADYQVRIFTPGMELPFAGHPTLGTCQAWLQAGGQLRSAQAGTVVQQCAVGLVPIRIHESMLAFAAPPLKRGAPPNELLQAVAAALDLTPAHILAAQVLDNGPLWLGLLLDSQDRVLKLKPDHTELKRLNQKVGVAARVVTRTKTMSSPDADLEVRAFAAPAGIVEDPVTGSLNASLAQWLMAEDLMPQHYVAAQGTCLKRMGRVHLQRDAQGQVWVGGQVQNGIEGTVIL
jgi:PhzF family phenazine biosynthesis protein